MRAARACLWCCLRTDRDADRDADRDSETADARREARAVLFSHDVALLRRGSQPFSSLPYGNKANTQHTHTHK